MDPRLRYAPVAALGVLILVRVFNGDFLSNPVFPTGGAWVQWISWWGVIVIILAQLSAFILAPHFVTWVNASARYYALPAIVVFSIIVAGVWGWDAFWNSTVRAFCDTCPESQILDKLTIAIFGGP